MAKSHHDVGIAFGKCKSANGSRMTSTHAAQPLNTTNAPNPPIFNLQAVGVSYRTVVARVMHNAHTDEHELWITPRRYSSSTQRHKGYLESGFRKERPECSIYTTSCIDDNLPRHNPYYVKRTLTNINQCLPDVDKPRLREATRRGTLTSCLHSANVAMTNFTRGIPLDAIDAPTLYELQHTIDFITTTLQIPDIDEVRAAVRGYLVLSGDKGAV